MMPRILILVLSIALLLPPATLDAQDNTPDCAPEAIQARVQALFRAYDEGFDQATTTGSAISELELLQTELDAIEAECAEARRNEAIDIITALREGGVVIYVRHAQADPGQVDTSLESCATQRNLTEQGRNDASTIGEVWPSVVSEGSTERLISTEYCRTMDTARLAFGEPEIINRQELGDLLLDFFSTPLDAGENLIIVGHIGLLGQVTDLILGEGDAILFQPLGADGYEVLGRVPVSEWAYLGEIAAEMAEE